MKNELVFHNKNNQDLFKLLHLIYEKNNKARKTLITDYIKENNVEPHVIQAIASIGGISLVMNEKEGEGIICEFFEELKDEGRIEGERKGRIEGKIEGRKEGRIEGRIEGRKEGKIEGRAQEIIEMGREFKLSDEDVLKRL